MSALRARPCFLPPTWLRIAVVVEGVKTAVRYFSAVMEEPDELAGGGVNGFLGLVCASMCILLAQLYHRHRNDIHLMPSVLIAACNRTRCDFATAIAQDAAKQHVFAFRLAQNGSELYIGDTNTADHSGVIEYHRHVG